jgi:hypothetical protein
MMLFPGLFLVATTLSFNLVETGCATRSTPGPGADDGPDPTKEADGENAG